jgi:pyrroline-5-carboxylate reductase
MTNIAVLGGGRMGAALVAGLRDAGFDGDDLRIAESDADRRKVLERDLPDVRVVPSASWAVADADVVVVAVKPGDVALLLDSCAEALGPGRRARARRS